MSRTLHALAFVAVLAACGGTEVRPGGSGGSGGSGQSARTGRTPCLNAECSPGQYCEGGALCIAGCTSDANCLADAKCVDISDVSHVGHCESGTSNNNNNNNNNPPPRDATCDSYAAHARECGLLASEAEAIKLSCAQLDAQTKTALLACNASTSCAELRSCSGTQCFTNADCPNDKPHCVMRSEVVDPFNDIPYTCR